MEKRTPVNETCLIVSILLVVNLRQHIDTDVVYNCNGKFQRNVRSIRTGEEMLYNTNQNELHNRTVTENLRKEEMNMTRGQ